MTHYTAAEYRQLKKDAKAFARKAKAGATYYIVQKPQGVKNGHYLGEIEFTKRPLVGLMWGSFSPERLYEHFGPVYEDRGHPAIRDLPTAREARLDEAAFEEKFLSSEGHHERVQQATAGTGFRSTW